MKNLARSFRPAVLLVSFGLVASAAFASTVTLDLTNAIPQSPTYSGHAGTGTFSNDISGLQYFNVSAQSGNPFQFPAQLQLFCIELAQNISLPSTGNVFTVLGAAQGSSDVNSGLSANISFSGIGATRAANLEVLYAHAFGTNYNPAALSDTSKLAFQLATWELSHDDNFNLLSGAGNEFWVTTPVDAAINEAQTLVSWVQANAATAAKMNLTALHSDSVQDFLVPTDFVLIPEPSTYGLMAGVAAIAVALRRRRLTPAR